MMHVYMFVSGGQHQLQIFPAGIVVTCVVTASTTESVPQLSSFGGFHYSTVQAISYDGS
jgi:hypothetical protein